MISCPCKGCWDRQVGCHADCEKYQAYNAMREKIRTARQRENLATDSHYQRKRQKKNSLLTRK